MTRNIWQIIEEQITQWHFLHSQWLQYQNTSGKRHLWPNVVAISQAYRSNGTAIARHVGELLGIPVYDREIVEHIAKKADVSLATVLALDEHVQSRIDEYMISLFHERNFDRNDYLTFLSRVVITLWHHGPCVLNGHGCVHLISRQYALLIRLTAPLEVRVQRAAEVDRLDLQAAQRLVYHKDMEREIFHHRFFKANVYDPHLYDITINTNAMTPLANAHIIKEAFHRKFPQFPFK